MELFAPGDLRPAARTISSVPRSSVPKRRGRLSRWKAVRFPWRGRATPRQLVDVGIAPPGASESRPAGSRPGARCQCRIVDVALLLAGIERCLIRCVERGLASIAERKIRIG